jgi:hypothetical protein
MLRLGELSKSSRHHARAEATPPPRFGSSSSPPLANAPRECGQSVTQTVQTASIISAIMVTLLQVLRS